MNHSQYRLASFTCPSIAGYATAFARSNKSRRFAFLMNLKRWWTLVHLFVYLHARAHRVDRLIHRDTFDRQKCRCTQGALLFRTARGYVERVARNCCEMGNSGSSSGASRKARSLPNSPEAHRYRSWFDFRGSLEGITICDQVFPRGDLWPFTCIFQDLPKLGMLWLRNYWANISSRYGIKLLDSVMHW